MAGGEARRRREARWECLAKLTHAALLAACALCLPFTLVATVAYPFMPVYRECKEEVDPPLGLAMACANAVLSAPGALWLVLRDRAATWHLRLAAIYATLNWLTQVAIWQAVSYGCYFASTQGEMDAGLGSAIQLALAALMGGTMLSGIRLIILRLTALERACLLELHMRLLERLFLFVGFLLCAMGASLFLRQPIASAVILVLALPPVCLGALIVLGAQCKTMWMASVAMKQAPEGRSAQACEMHRALRKELVCTLLMSLTSLFVLLISLDRTTFRFTSLQSETWMNLLGRVCNMVDALCNQWYALHLSGAASGALKGTAARAAATKKRRDRWLAAEAQWRQRQERRDGESALWDEKVYELTGRGISLEALLKFYRLLPGLMGSYDPARHTTGDVVRGAIIPFTAKERASGASVLMQGSFTVPDKMVTHNWSNLFRDLLAAILADALGENDFSMIAELLMDDAKRLESWVANTGVGHRSYWVCAFSVNQHAGICGYVRPTSKDTVTGLRPEECTCGLPKALNNTAPLMSDGRSIPCEMNKFDDMMKVLSARDPDFEQILAIDTHFGLFSRAWCVAEIAAASSAGMAQRLKIHTQKALAQHSERLHSLKIQNMEASRAEDKKAILESISDLDAFNRDLQDLLFKDLFPAWTSLDAEERMAKAGAVIRWMPVWAHGKPQPAAALLGHP